jgi:chromosome segregation ATPase
LDDTFEDGDKLYNFYGNLIRMIKKNGLEAVSSEIQTSLPRLSEIGSKDYMSIAFVYDESKIDVMSDAIESRLTMALSQDLESLKKELAEWECKIEELNQRIEKSNKELKDLESRKPAMEREYQRVKADYEKTLKSLQNIKGEKPTETESR